MIKAAMIFRSLILPALTLWVNTSFAQWSVKEGDPRVNEQESYLYQVFTKSAWEASNFAKPSDLKWYNDARYGMFIHFGLNAYVNKDMSWPIVYNHKAPDSGHGSYPDSAWQRQWPALFKLEKFNADEWVDIAREAGMKYIVVIAKHHDGFHMWDTKYSDFKITHTPFGRDYLKEVIDACHKAKMPVGVYYSQRDWYHPDYAPIDTASTKRISAPPYFEALPGHQLKAGATHRKYMEYQFNVVKELCTRYGKLDLFWFDAAYWGGMFTADMWDAENLTRMIRSLQPGILINNRTSLPGDFDTPEQRIGMYQQRSWESAMTLNGSWGYSPDRPVKPVKTLIREMLTAASGNGNVLLSWGARFNGAFDAVQIDTLMKIGGWLKKYGHAYYGTRGGPWMPHRNYGTVFKGNKVFLYLFGNAPEGLLLPALPGNAIVNATFVNGNGPVNWRKEGKLNRFYPPAFPDSIVSIIELTMAKTVKGVLASGTWSLFDDPAYGKSILQKKPGKNNWSGSAYNIDLENRRNITGIRISGNSSYLQVGVSMNGTDWEPVGRVEEASGEISLTTFMTGVNVPGRMIRYIRLQAKQVPEALQVELFEK